MIVTASLFHLAGYPNRWENFAALGIDRFLDKPWSIDELIDVLSKQPPLKAINQPSFEYARGDNDRITFSDASAGQQATTLLTVLLNQDGPPLIIDQPKEDLDNPTMPDIIKEVWNELPHEWWALRKECTLFVKEKLVGGSCQNCSVGGVSIPGALALFFSS